MSAEVYRTHLAAGSVSTLMKTIRAALVDLLHWPALSWLQPKATVRVVQADGSMILMKGRHQVGLSGAAPRARFFAVVLSPDDCLMRTLNLPDMPNEDIARALALEVASHSPFSERDTVWGWRIDRRSQVMSVTVAITSWRLVASRLRQRELPEHPAPEVWADSNPPLVISGFGEGPRQSTERRMASAMLAVSVVLVSALLLLAATPLLQLRLQVNDAARQFSELNRTAAAIVEQREALVRARLQADAIREALGGRAKPLEVLETLAALLPDSAHLLDLEVRGDRVQMTGVSANASALIEHVGSDERIRGLRPTSAISRVGPEGEENFSVEFTYVRSPGGA